MCVHACRHSNPHIHMRLDPMHSLRFKFGGDVNTTIFARPWERLALAGALSGPGLCQPRYQFLCPRTGTTGHFLRTLEPWHPAPSAPTHPRVHRGLAAAWQTQCFAAGPGAHRGLPACSPPACAHAGLPGTFVTHLLEADRL